MLGPRLVLVLCFAVLALTTIAAVAAGIWLISVRLPETAGQLTTIVIIYGGGLAMVLLTLIALFWAYLDHAIGQPLAAMTRGVQTAAYANDSHRLEIEDGHQLHPLPAAINDLIGRWAAARASVAQAIAAATAHVEQQKNALAGILRDLHEGVVVCSLDHRILLYNSRALALLHVGGEVGLNRPLTDFVTRQPVLHALSRLTAQVAGKHGDGRSSEVTIPFVAATVDGRHTLQGRMGLIFDAGSTACGYVISFEDKTETLASLGLRDRLLRESSEGLRAPIANLRAAIEILSSGDRLDPADEAKFRQVALAESQHLSSRVEMLAAQYREIVASHWPMSDIDSGSLFESLRRRVREQLDVTLTIVGLPVRLHGDSYTLVELLDRLIRRTSRYVGEMAFDAEAVSGSNRVYLDIAWNGPVLPAAELDRWLDEEVEDALAGLSLREILERHRTDVWSFAENADRSRLRLPLAPSAPQAGLPSPPDHPPRPEFYDLGLLKPAPASDRGSRLLRSLTFVAFDTETTGLQPGKGDEIVSLAGVRIVNGRILTGESFVRVVDPQRPIPPASTRFHGITEAMVKDKPPITVVLPQFRAFVGDAVLIGHNADFDLAFFKLKEAECGVTFDMPVLDTLLLSAFLHDHTNRHSLDATAERFGVTIHDRHTALGDAAVTAAIFLKMIDLLAAHDITTLNDALAVCQRIGAARASGQRA